MVRRVIFCALAVLALDRQAAAQPVGTFQFQLLPYCNVIALAVVRQGPQYQLDGTDNQCGGGPRASVTGLAFPNPSGLLGFGFTIVTAPGGVPVHVDAELSLSTLSGTWRDSTGLTGSFLLVTNGGGPGLTRPPASAGDISAVTAGSGLSGGGTSGPVALAVDFAATQQRVTGTCPATQLMRAVNQDGSVVCESVTSAGGGDITAVTAGAGLTGGAVTGDAAVAVNFGGPGAAATVARSDHTHAVPGNGNTGVGAGALTVASAGQNTALGNLALRDTTTGQQNTAAGYAALAANVSGQGNVAVGAFALQSAPAASSNVAVGLRALQVSSAPAATAVGANALAANTTGAGNAAFGSGALANNTVGGANTGLGSGALGGNTTGTSNTAVGNSALTLNQTGGDNVAVGYMSLFTNSAAWNTAVGTESLRDNTSGLRNTAVGNRALWLNTTGSFNAAVGRDALGGNTTGASNVAVGNIALWRNSTGDQNVGIGAAAFGFNDTGSGNTVIGASSGTAMSASNNNVIIGANALSSMIGGNDNIAIGAYVGTTSSPGNNNIYIGKSLVTGGGESNTIRIGNSGAVAAFITGISGATSSGGAGVFVNAAGQLGTLTSSARFKEQIAPLGDTFHARVQALRPVRFVYKPEFDDGSKQAQYGLIAEEVAEVFPELVLRNADGSVQTVRYHFLAPLLLAEVQRLERERATADAERTHLADRVRRLEETLATALAALQRR